MRIIIYYCNSVGKPITTWIHTDGAHELKGAGMIDLANEYRIRITTSSVGSSRQNRQEPTWRATCAAMRTELTQSRLPYSFWRHAFSHAEQGRNIRPSRAAPFDTRLGRLLGRKPKGVYRRPFGCLCYLLCAGRASLRWRHASPQGGRAGAARHPPGLLRRRGRLLRKPRDQRRARPARLPVLSARRRAPGRHHRDRLR